MAKFDLASKLREAASNLNTGAEQIEYVPFELLDPDESNFYSLDGLDELADSIATVGILTPLRVRQNGERYTITSGHRRRAAVQLLIDSGEDWSRGLPCIVDRGETTPEWEELKLIFANRQRVKTSAELSREAARTDELFCALREKGYEFPGRMQEHVAQALGVKASKLKRLHAIRNRAQEYVLNAYDEGKINESVAYELSKCELGVQKMIMVQFLRSGRPTEELTAETVSTIASAWTHMCNRACKKDPWSNCRYVGANHFEEGLRRRFAGIEVGNCIKGFCCKGCKALPDCEEYCEKVEEDRKQAQDDRARRQEEIERTAEQLRADADRANAEAAEECARIWARIRKAAQASGVELENVLAELCETRADIEQALRYMDGTEADYGFASELLASELEFLADRLECSTDFLLGRTEEPRPVMLSGGGAGVETSGEDPSTAPLLAKPGSSHASRASLCSAQDDTTAAAGTISRGAETGGDPSPGCAGDKLGTSHASRASECSLFEREPSADEIEARWSNGTPTEEGWYACLGSWKGIPERTIAYFWDGCWYEHKRKLRVMAETEVTAYFRLPDIEEV